MVRYLIAALVMVAIALIVSPPRPFAHIFDPATIPAREGELKRPNPG